MRDFCLAGQCSKKRELIGLLLSRAGQRLLLVGTSASAIATESFPHLADKILVPKRPPRRSIPARTALRSTSDVASNPGQHTWLSSRHHAWHRAEPYADLPRKTAQFRLSPFPLPPRDPPGVRAPVPFALKVRYLEAPAVRLAPPAPAGRRCTTRPHSRQCRSSSGFGGTSLAEFPPRHLCGPPRKTPGA